MNALHVPNIHVCVMPSNPCSSEVHLMPNPLLEQSLNLGVFHFTQLLWRLKAKQKSKMCPDLSYHAKGPQSFSVLFSTPTWLTLSAGKCGAVCAGKIG